MAERRVDGKVIMITGAAGGIGRAISRRLAEAGAYVIACDIAPAPNHVAAEATGHIEPAILDVTSPEAWENLVRATVEKHGRLDQLWNNAGIAPPGRLLDLTAEDWTRTFAVNVVGAASGCRAALTVMLEQEPGPTGERGRIINTSSPSALRFSPITASYGASKAALNHLTRTIAAIYGPQGICAAVIYPGNVDTPMWRNIDEVWSRIQGVPSGSMAAAFAAAVPTGRFQTVEELAEFSLYLATAPAALLNGQAVWTDAIFSPI
jgi:NAD(P)-dependent dehydrogenase (short-subunit alcohol dehydrogenase family)